MNGRTLYPRLNDTWSQWLDRLIRGTRWITTNDEHECLNCGMQFCLSRQVSPNDTAATNMELLRIMDRRHKRCPSCGSDLVRWVHR